MFSLHTYISKNAAPGLLRVIMLRHIRMTDTISDLRDREGKRERNGRMRETHLQVSVVTDRLRVSSSVSASGVRYR